MNFILVFIGGGIGSVFRFIMTMIIGKTSLSLPVATLSSNVLSCLIFGAFIYAYQEKNLIPEHYKHFVLIGICGGLSTFSTFSFESFELLKQGLYGWAIINIAVSCILCFGIFFMFSK